jgi:hypothetical protein
MDKDESLLVEVCLFPEQLGRGPNGLATCGAPSDTGIG